MSHSSQKRWADVAAAATDACTKLVNCLLDVESVYQDLLELYSYTGNNAQDFADQLFKETWEARFSAGVQAVITHDVVGNVVTNPLVTVPGSGYTEGTGYALPLVQSGNGDAVLNYDVNANGAIVNVTVAEAGTNYDNGTGYNIDNMPVPGNVYDTQANAAEVALAQDVIAALTSVHEIYNAADNKVVAQEDRFVAMRRFT